MSKRWLRFVIAIAFVLGVILVGDGAACADAPDQTTGGFALNRFEPAERGGAQFFVLDSLDIRNGVLSSPLRPAIGTLLDYLYKPLIVEDTTGTERFAIVRHQVVMHTMASLIALDRIRAGIDVPLAIYQDGEGGFVQGQDLRAAGKPALGDLRVAADVRILGSGPTATEREGQRESQRESPFTFALGLRAWLPTGVRSQFMSDGSLRASPQLLASGSLLRDASLVWAARTGVLIRSGSTGAELGNELLVQIGLGLRLFHARLLVGPELWASSVIAGGDRGRGSKFLGKAETPVEAILGAHYEIVRGSGLRVGVGAGSGITRGFGSPGFRGLLSIEWAPPYVDPNAGLDRDGDGVRNDVDACPDVFGRPDSSDPITNGCPPPPPVPIEDTDRDGISDMDDACPGLVGVRTDDPMTNGCPPNTGTPRPLAVVTKAEIKIGEQILFSTDSSDLQLGADGSTPVLAAVKKLLDEHPEIRRVRIEGHTDNVGDATYNDQLSTRRASSVVTWLVDHGVAQQRLESAGLGSKRPLDTTDTEAGRARNRRVVFVIIERE